jgi:hypothetical protein
MTSFLRPLLTAVAVLVVCATPARADVCDLSAGRSTCDPPIYGGAYYSNVLPSGTYNVDPFLQVRATGTESGYNTSGLELSKIPLVTIGSIEYREFMLSIDEPGNDPMISLDQLQIFLSSSATESSYNTTTRTLGTLNAIYDLDSGGDDWIKLNYQLAKQSGPGAMIVYIPNYLFTQSGGQYVYLYSQLGSTALPSGGGMEEWWVRSTTGSKTITRVPEPGLLLLFGTASLFAGRRFRRRFKSN